MSKTRKHPWTYTPTDMEMAYMRQSLGGFFDDELLIDVLYKVRVGKEATCYCCRADPRTGYGLVAAKVYRPAMFRAMRNDWYYRIGRTINTGGRGSGYRRREQLALRKHTRFGKSIEKLSWTSNEYEQLTTLHQLGADVPQPLANASSAILMEYFGDEVRGAPTLHSVKLEAQEANTLFDRVMGNITLMLRQMAVHADLSPHNILFWNGQIRVIDLPQAVSADRHPGAFELLTRDIDRVCSYFAKQGVACNATALAIELWQKLQRGEL